MADDSPLSENELLRLIDDEIAASVSFDNDNEADRREIALEYYRGEMNDLPAEPGWSSAVSKDVADTVDFMLPGLLRVFAGAGQVAVYQPGKPGDEQMAAQATDYVNYVWNNEVNGYLVLMAAIHDALTVRNGIIKVYWDDTPEVESEDLSGLSDEQITMLEEDPEVEIVGYRPNMQTISDPMTGQTIPLQFHDVRIQRIVQPGRLAVEAIPPEDFGLSAGAATIERARMPWHRSLPTRSELIKQGYAREVVDDLPAYSPDLSSTKTTRENDILGAQPNASSALEEVEVYDCYPLYDMDGDGVAERCRVVVAGGRGGRKLLAVDPWPEEDLPFVDLTPQPVPHRWMGTSVADNVMDLQRVKTALLRQMLNNLYLVNHPEREIVENAINNPDEVLRRKIAGVIRVKSAGSIRDLVTPYIGDKALQGIQYIDAVIQRRTGVSHSSAALDATALEPQTATAEQLEHDANYARIELVARNMAELGLKSLFRKMLRIIVRHQDRPRTIRLRNKWIDMDPRAWNAAMDVTINVGLGTGSRERDLRMLAGVGAQQDLVVKQLGPNNPIVPPSKWIATRQKMIEASGLRDPDQYFEPLTDEQFGQWQQANPPPADPKVEAAKMLAQARMEEAQARVQLNALKNATDAQIKSGKAMADIETSRLKMMTEAELRQAEMALEAELKQIQMMLDTHAREATNITRPQ